METDTRARRHTPMKTRHHNNQALLLRLFLSISVLIAGGGFLLLAANAAGSFGAAAGAVFGGAPGDPGFAPFVVGLICIIYGFVGLLFRREDR